MEMIRVAKEIHVNPDIKICMACGMLKINEQLTLNKKYL
jgi:biotin synthase-like enzyme